VRITDLGTPVKMKTRDLKPAPDNPRTIPQRAIDIVQKSLEEFGWQQPLVVDKDLTLIVGHTRWMAAKELGVKECPVIVAEHLTPDQVKAYRIADNRTHDFTSWDYPSLVQQLDDLSADFSDVLGLQDWEQITADFDLSLDVDDDLAPRLDPNGGFQVTVIFATADDALRADPVLAKLDGVVDIRHKNQNGQE
jgi:hypothetical protein